MRRAWYRIVANFVILLTVAIVLTQLSACASKPDVLYFDGTEVAEERKFIKLRTGQICEVKNMKITACEYNPREYAESTDIEEITEEKE